MSLKIGQIGPANFLIDRPFHRDSELLLKEWFDAVGMFLNSSQFIDKESFVAAVNETFQSLQNHSPNFDPHLYRAKRSLYDSARRVKAKQRKIRPTRAFLLLEGDFRRIESIETVRDDKAREKVRLFSPLYFLRRILTADDFLESEAYAHAIIRAEIFAAAIKSFPPEVGQNIYEYIGEAIKYQNISKSLASISSYIAKRDTIYLRDASDFIVGNLLASQGYAYLNFEHGDILNAKSRSTEREWMPIGTFLSNSSIAFTAETAYELRFVRDLDVLPSASQILSELDGIPLALPGARMIFSGGIRATESNGTVVRITGKSGTGKTTLALSICTALAPLGTSTFYLSCEEEQEDLIDRIYSVTPPFIANTRKFLLPKGVSSFDDESWFTALHLNANDPSSNFSSVELFIDEIVSLYESKKTDPKEKRPPGLVPFVVVLDGVHEVVAPESHGDAADKLHALVNKLRELNALVVLLSADIDNQAFRSLDYLVDVVIKLDSLDQSGNSIEKLRSFRLEKTRRQFSHTGNHRYHISKQGGVKLYPNLPSILETFKRFRWQEPDRTSYFDFLGSRDLTGERSSNRPWLKIFEKSHTLITGQGSSGKASFALRLLTSPLRNDRRTSNAYRDMFDSSFSEAELQSRRLLIISFLYPESYYAKLIRTIQKSKYPDRLGMEPTPEIFEEVMSFYPGHLQPEVLVGKIAAELHRGHVDGLPYDSVLIDGLHNVFLQFPGLESDTLIWPILSEIFRRSGVTLVTTHAHFNVIGMDQDQHLAFDVRSMANRSVPLLQSLVNSADYYLDVSPFMTQRADGIDISLVPEHASITVATALGQPIPARPEKVWNRTTMVVENALDYGLS